MKRTFLAIALAVYGHAQAAGAYDGVYADPATPNHYISVHTSGDRIIATQYQISPASGVTFQTAIGSVIPRQINSWQLLGGTISGASARLSGQLMFNQCNVEVTASFTGSTVDVRINNAASSGAGSSSSIECQALVSPNLPIRFNKIF